MTPSSRGRGRRPAPDPFLTERARKRRRERTKARHRRFARLVLGGLLGGLLFLVAASFTGAAIWMSSCNLNSLKPVEVGENSFVYAADGTLLGSIPAEHNRQPVPLKDISPWMARAVIATEDRRFYEHGGVDYEGIFRAAWRDLTEGRIVEGGSTITQQLVRNLYPVSRERTIERKIKEACLAIKLKKHWSNGRIL